MSLILRRNILLGGRGGITPPTPPEPSDNIAYIRGGGSDGAYIDTGIVPDSSTRVIVWARNWNPGGENYTFLFGSRVSGTQAMFALSSLNGANTGKIRISYGAVNTDLLDKWSLFSWYHKYELNGKDFYVDDVLVGSGETGTISSSLNIYLFGLNNNGSYAGTNLPIDICAAKIYQNGILVRDYTAVNTPSVGLYDSISNTVFTNAGGGSFTYGTFNMSSYERLDYISCNEDAYFDSGVYGGYSLPVVCKFNCPTIPGRCCVGYRGTSDWMEFEISNTGGVRVYYRLASDAQWRYFYTNSDPSKVAGNDIVLIKGTTNSATIYKNYAKLGNTISPTSSTGYVSSDTLAVAALKTSNSFAERFIGKLYYVGLGSQRSYVPAKYGSSVGMYDTYNDVFKMSESGVPFSEPQI